MAMKLPLSFATLALAIAVLCSAQAKAQDEQAQLSEQELRAYPTSEAKFIRGNDYYLGRNIHANPYIAARWYEAAMKQGNLEAQYSFGWLLMTAYGAKRDEARGIALIRAAADRGLPAAMFGLARLGLKWDPPRIEKAEAERWLEKAAHTGDIKVIEFAVDYYEGVDRKNYPSPLAIKYLRLGAKLGDTASQDKLGEYLIIRGCAGGSAYAWQGLIGECLDKLKEKLDQRSVSGLEEEGLCWLRRSAAIQGISQPQTTKINCSKYMQ